MASQGFAAAALRDRVYASGLVIALLLDRLAPGWAKKLVTDPGASLDGMLQAQAGNPSAECDISAARRRAENERAARDITALHASRIAELEEFSDSTGWRVIIESVAPLWPQGFDPLNVEVLAPGAVVHRRFVKLGNDAATVEVLNAKALTHAAGPHPLFNGASRIIVRIAAAPQVNVDGARTTISAPGLQATLQHASTTQDGNTLIVRTTNDQ